MTKTELKQQIKAHFKSRRAFIYAFNEAVGYPALDETALSRQLSEKDRVSLSNGWQSAYTLFFKSLNPNKTH